MVIDRGEVRWAELSEPRGAEPGFRRPVVVMQSNAFNRSRIGTVIVVVLTSNLRLLDSPGNVLIPAKLAGLTRDSVANVSQVMTVDRRDLGEAAGRLDALTLKRIEAGLRLVLAL